ncbi:hypothetical protein DYH09_13065 [bacterium CPR1]|nr:hypothetical protein [bacterium CPR1]
MEKGCTALGCLVLLVVGFFLLRGWWSEPSGTLPTPASGPSGTKAPVSRPSGTNEPGATPAAESSTRTPEPLSSPPGPASDDPFSVRPEPGADPFAPPSPVQPLELPGPDRLNQALPERLVRLQAAARASNTAYDWRQLADAAVKAEHFALASQAYRQEADIYRRTGDPHAARAEELKAARYATEIELYLEQRAPAGQAGARLEPTSGCYLGAFIDRDDNLPSVVLQSQRHGDVPRFNQLTGKNHSSFFMYRSYGQPFPFEWAEQVKASRAIPQIAWEPRSLDQVQDDAYLQGFVAEVARFDWPVFIRFAGEMNGEWTPYHGDPPAYRRAFRTVYQAFRKAPRAALIWCPNSVPVTGLEEYYPGDDAVDWVGVNLYSVLFLDNDPARPGEAVNPTDLLDPVYRKFSARKPIAIGEYAASHQSALSPATRPDFAVDKMRQLYESLPTRYPRVKLVSWYDCNNLVHARPGRQLNNYLVSEPREVLEAYRAIIRQPHFLAAGQQASAVVAVRLESVHQVKAGQTVLIWARSYLSRPRVFLRVDGKLVSDRSRWKLTGLKPGKHKLEVLVYDDRGRLAGRLERAVRID